MVRHVTLIGLTAFALFSFEAVEPADAAVPLTGEESAAIVINLADLLANEPGLPLPVRQSYEALNAYYQEEAGPLLWIGSDRMVTLVERLSTAQVDGLDQADYPIDKLAEFADIAEETDIRGKAIIELYFSAAFLEYASDLQVGRFLPRKVDPNFFLQAREIDPLAALNGALNADNLNAFFDSWQPQAQAYSNLKQALAEYRTLEAVGGWPAVPLGDALKPGMSDPRVPALRARLTVTEGVAASAPPGGEDLYDDELVAAVQAFQVRHGLEVDGVAGNQTMIALNVPIEDRIEALVVAMERWRWTTCSSILPASTFASYAMAPSPTTWPWSSVSRTTRHPSSATGCRRSSSTRTGTCRRVSRSRRNFPSSAPIRAPSPHRASKRCKATESFR